jgi:hypothetical protein
MRPPNLCKYLNSNTVCTPLLCGAYVIFLGPSPILRTMRPFGPNQREGERAIWKTTVATPLLVLLGGGDGVTRVEGVDRVKGGGCALCTVHPHTLQTGPKIPSSLNVHKKVAPSPVYVLSSLWSQPPSPLHASVLTTPPPPNH